MGSEELQSCSNEADELIFLLLIRLSNTHSLTHSCIYSFIHLTDPKYVPSNVLGA
jgi:hypothetical protein